MSKSLTPLADICIDPRRSLLGMDKLAGFSWKGPDREKSLNTCLRDIRTSHKFALDAQACAAVNTLAHSDPDRRLARKCAELANAPFPTVWLEFKIKDRLGYDAETPDSHVAYCITRAFDARPEHYSILVYQGDETGNKWFQWPWCGVVSTDGADCLNDFGRLKEFAPNFPGLTWGYEGAAFEGELLNQLDDVGAGFSLTHNEIDGIKIAQELAGVVRFVVCAFALINEGPVLIDEFKPQGRFLTSHGPRAYFSASTVRLQIPQKFKTRKGQDSFLCRHISGIKKRRHDVKGHWRICHSGKRVWIKEHARGDAGLGYVRATYLVEGRAA